MSDYTEQFDLEAETLSLDDDGYEERLREIASRFRGFDEAFTDFIIKHGYTGERTDADFKARFLQEKYKAAGVKPPRDLKKWFDSNRRLKRETVFPICFVFRLGVSESNDFFRCVPFERGFDCHTINEAVYYFCIKNGLSYADAREMLDRIPKPEKRKVIPGREILYTGAITKYIDSIDDREKLIQYLTDHIGDFTYNNATAIGYVQKLWKEISKENGLAVQEGILVNQAYNWSGDLVIAAEGASTWTIFSQIIGLDRQTEKEYAQKHDRSLASVMSENALLPLSAGDCFPSRQGIDRLIRGELSDNELIRKMLIFLVFYTYWAKKIIKNKDAFYPAQYGDAEGCLDTIDNYLMDAGYPQLYAGNPYDWLFKWSLNDEHPLEAFRTYMVEIFAAKKELTDGED